MRARSPMLLLPALLAAAACDLKPGVEGDTGRAEALVCTSGALSYGGCVRGTATKDEHGYHVAFLRRGDRVNVKLTRESGDLNPGLALKSPKYSVAVRHESVNVRGDSVDKTWTVKSTGFYKFVAFPWSNRGAGEYRMDMTCVGGPCMQGLTLDAEVVGACIGEARDCTLRQLGAADATPEAVSSMFDACLSSDQMPAVCATACPGDGAESVCAETVNRLRPFAGRGASCVEEIQSCIDDCVPFNTTGEPIADLANAPDMLCWAGSRANCSAFGQGLAACRDPQGVTGEGYAVGDQEWCAATCLAREGNPNQEDCNARCAPQPNADVDLPDVAAAEAE